MADEISENIAAFEVLYMYIKLQQNPSTTAAARLTMR